MTGSSAWNCSNRSLTTILPEEHSTGMMEEHSTGMMKHIRKHSDKIIMSTFQEKKDKVSYYWSLGYLNNEGIVIGDKYKSYRSRLKLDFDVTSWLSAGVNVQYSYRDQGAIPRSVNQIWANTPYSTPTDLDGNPMLYPTGIDNASSINSAYNDSFIDRSAIRNSFTGSMYAKNKTAVRYFLSGKFLSPPVAVQLQEPPLFTTSCMEIIRRRCGAKK